MLTEGVSYTKLLDDLIEIINEARSTVASQVNTALTMMYWNIGERINRDILKSHRAAYGQQIVAQVARQLQEVYGNRGFDVKKYSTYDAVCKKL